MFYRNQIADIFKYTVTHATGLNHGQKKRRFTFKKWSEHLLRIEIWNQNASTIL